MVLTILVFVVITNLYENRVDTFRKIVNET